MALCLWTVMGTRASELESSLKSFIIPNLNIVTWKMFCFLLRWWDLGLCPASSGLYYSQYTLSEKLDIFRTMTFMFLNVKS